MFAINTVWNNFNPNRTEILRSMCIFPASLHLNDLYSAPDSPSYFMKGIIMYGSNHYVTYLRVGITGVWYKYNDDRVEKLQKDGDLFDVLTDAMK